MIDEYMIDALRFYGGDIRMRNANGQLAGASRDAFWGDKEAYRTLNALLFSGISSEYSRVAIEGHRLNPVFAERIEETINLYLNIFRLMCAVRSSKADSVIIAKRVEREAALAVYEQGVTSSFVSASKKEFDSTFADKHGIILLELQVENNVPYIDFEHVLSGEEYLHAEEKEVLLPPFLEITMNKMELTMIEKRRLKDMNNKPPKEKYSVRTIKFPDYANENLSKLSIQKLYEEICMKKKAAAESIIAMNSGNWTMKHSDYIMWKELLQSYLKIYFSDMWYRGEEYGV